MAKRRKDGNVLEALVAVSGGAVGVVLVLIALGFALGLLLTSGGVLNRDVRTMVVERAEALQPYKIGAGVAGVILGGIVKVGVVGAFVYIIGGASQAVVRWMKLKAGTVHAKRGLFPVIELADGVLYDPNRDNLGAHPVITAGALEVQRSAAISHAEGLKASLTLAGGDASASPVAELSASLWPSKVDLRELLGNSVPTLTGLVLGVTMNDQGRRETVKGDMGSLVHIAVGGSSGWGKSVFLQSLAFQLLQAQERPDLAAIDLEGVTLNVLAQSDRLLYPLADDEATAAAVLQGLTEEIERRKALYAQAGAGVASLGAYNRVVSDGDRLRPVILLVDEATALLEDKAVEDALKTVTLRARKYGVWAILCGQDWKASTLSTAIRNQLSTRVQFKAMSPTQSRVLVGTGDAADIQAKGRAIAELPGRGRLMLQAPMVTAAMFASVAAHGDGPRRDLPDVAKVSGGVDLAQTARIRDLRERGDSLNSIQLEVFGYTGGAAYNAVKAALDG
jgi:hypothetical protein